MAAAALAASCAALTGTPIYASQARAQQQRPSTPDLTWPGGSGSRAVLLSSALAVHPDSASASSLPAARRITATRELTRDLRKYRVPAALLVIALLCLIVLITLRIRRRRAAKSHALDGVGEPAGRHAVAGPAGSREVPVGWPDFVPYSDNNRSVPPPAPERSSSEGSRLGDQVADKFSWYGPARAEEAHAEETHVEETRVEETRVEETHVEKTPAEETRVEETEVEKTPAEETQADGGAPTRDMPPGPLPSRRSQRKDNGTRPAPGGPPWEPAEKPPGEFPWASTNPGSLA